MSSFDRAELHCDTSCAAVPQPVQVALPDMIVCCCRQAPATAAVTEMLQGGNPRASAAAACLIRETLCRTGAQPGPVSAANRRAVANSHIVEVLADLLQPGRCGG